MLPAPATPAKPAPKPPALRAILWGGLLCGTLDALFAIVLWGTMRGVAPGRVLRAIAGGLLGPEAFQGGAGMTALGLALHFVIALGAAATFVSAARILPVLAKRPAISGALFGLAVYFFMNLVVLPLSATPPRAFPPPFFVVGLLGHIAFVGWPIAWAANRFLK
ncbi:MAG TPA: hypothetical protein VGD81_19165 [Opitutaceae bacterium]